MFPAMSIAALGNISTATVPGSLVPTITASSTSTMREDKSFRSSSSDSRPSFQQGYAAPVPSNNRAIRHDSSARGGCPCKDRTGTVYDLNSTRHTLFLFIRLSSFILGIALFVLALAGCLALVKKGRWIAPVVSPCASAWYPQGYDAFMILFRGKRASPYLRTWWDGGLAVAFAVTTGVLFFLVWDDVHALDNEERRTAGILGVVLVTGMFYQLICEVIVSIGGVRQSRELRREARGLPMTSV